MTPTRSCDCPHGFPLCVCALGLSGDELLHRSRLASAVAGWPSGRLDPEAVREHEALLARARRAAKPRLPLGAPQRPADDCGCGKARSTPDV